MGVIDEHGPTARLRRRISTQVQRVFERHTGVGCHVHIGRGAQVDRQLKYVVPQHDLDRGSGDAPVSGNHVRVCVVEPHGVNGQSGFGEHCRRMADCATEDRGSCGWW